MIDRHRVINEFEKLYDSGENEACLMPQCEAVCLAVEAKLRRAAYAGREEIILFAAALLNRRLTGKTADEDAVASFRAGEEPAKSSQTPKRKHRGRLSLRRLCSGMTASSL